MSERRKVPPWIAFLIVLWPLVLFALGFAARQFFLWMGCEISARGPQPCILAGKDWGETIYPLWALGYFLIYVLFWIPIGLAILGFFRFLQWQANATRHR